MLMETATEKAWRWARLSDGSLILLNETGETVAKIGTEAWKEFFKNTVGIDLNNKTEDKNTRAFRLFQSEEAFPIMRFLSRFSYYQREGNVRLDMLLEMHRRTGKVPQMSGFVSAHERRFEELKEAYERNDVDSLRACC